jgi:phosphotriesterase-related protein
VPALLDFLASSGKDLGRIAISHMDFDLDDLANHRRAADLGLYVELDLFGFPIWTAGNFLHMPTDTRRVEVLIELARAGYGRQLLISHDVCMKMQLPPWGGFGYSHILRNVVPLFEMLGSEAGLVSQICYENPRRLLCWSEAS